MNWIDIETLILIDMKEISFLSLRCQVGPTSYKQTVVTINTEGEFLRSESFSGEGAMTRYYEGKLCVVSRGENPQSGEPLCELKQGDKVDIWQLLPYDLVNDKPLENTRYFRVVLK